MRLLRLARFGLPLLGLPPTLSGCGHAGPATPTLSVSCGGSLMLAGATAVDVATAPGGSGAMLSFPDPANPGHTGTLPVPPGESCAITPVPKGGSDDTAGKGS